MRQETCEVCGYTSHLGVIERCHIVPLQLTEKAGVPESETLKLCCNCNRELDAWYAMTVADMAYDTKTKRFTAKSPSEIVKEHHSALDSFMKYKKEQREAG